MNALWYIKKRSFINKLKRRLKKPLTYVWILAILAYIALMVFSFSTTFEEFGMASPAGFVMILTGFALLTMPTNFKAYAKHKGLIFTPADIHLVFPSPVAPKTLLLYAMVRLMVSSWILSFALAIGGIWWFHLTWWQVVVYLFFAVVIETAFEASLVVLVYGNDKMPPWVLKLVSVAIYVMIGACVALGAYLFFFVETGVGALALLFQHPLLQCIPVIGWNIAVVRLIVLGPNLLNVICALLYLATTVVMVLAALRMPCHGEYYEDAMTFAEDYQAALKKSKEGKVVVVGKKEKYRQARIRYQGGGAKAIYYRQLLEYKKKRTFIFGWASVINLGVGIVLAVLGALGHIGPGEAPIIVPAVGVYMILIFSGYPSKWEQELKNAYTFLIPDNAFRKMWYATKVEHIRNLIDGCLIVLPGCLFMKLTLFQTVGCIIIYVCIKAAHLYARMVCQGILGQIFGQVGMSMLQMLIFLLIVGVGAFFGVIVGLFVSVEVGYLVMIFYSLVLTGGLAAASTALFARMEMIPE